MDEQEFCDQIDCNFPYEDRQRALHLIEVACREYSPNAAFFIADELARPPVRDRVENSAQLRLELLEVLDRMFAHPLKAMVFEIVRKMIREEDITGEETIKALHVLEAYPGMYAAASIVYFRCTEESAFVEVDQQYQRLIASWES